MLIIGCDFHTRYQQIPVPGALRKMTFGNNLTATTAFNNALEPCRINWNSSGTALGTCTDATPSGNLQDFSYAFNAGSTNNGNVASWSGTGQQAFTRTFGYDSLNRLATMQETSGVAEGCKPASSSSNPYNLTWGYDAWGNRTSQNPNAGTCSFSQNVNTQNQLSSPYQYDAAGNLINDGNHSYTYDAENRLISVDGGNTATYVYDALGRRVKSAVGSNSTEYIYDNNGLVSQELLNGHFNREYVRSNGYPIAEYYQGTTYFLHPDHLGSARLLTGMNQSVAQNLDYLPFGEILSSDSGTTTHKFTGDERDSETNLDHTQFRQYSSQLGRWMHPDPAGLAAVDPSNPQSWNRYSYVLNNPMNLIDPSGLNCKLPDGEIVDDNLQECEDAGGTYTNEPVTTGSMGGLGDSGLPDIPGLGFMSTASAGGGDAPVDSGYFFYVEVWGTTVLDTTGINGDTPGSGIDWAWWKGLATSPLQWRLPSDGPGSCFAVFENAVKGPVKALKSVRDNVNKDLLGMAGSAASGVTNVAIELNDMLRKRQLDPFLGPTVAAGATTIAAGLNSLVAGVARALPYVARGVLIAGDAVLAVGVAKEGYAAAWTGSCHP